MNLFAHRDRVKELALLVEPIARRLNAMASEPRRELKDDEASKQHKGIETNPPSIMDASGFFSSNTGALHASDFSKLPDNKAFESLRQATLKLGARDFQKLPKDVQGLAKLGGLLHTERLNLDRSVYHFMNDGQLVAVLNRSSNRLHVRSLLDADDYSDLHTLGRPSSAGQAPQGFREMSIMDVVWMYANHDPEALFDLPKEVGTHILSLRKLPTVSPHLMEPHHLGLIRQLLKPGQSFEKLAARYPTSAWPELLRDLTCLFLTRSASLKSAAARSLRAELVES